MLDAIRIESGQKVVLKKVSTISQEIFIALLLSSKEWKEDTRNCCVPIVDVMIRSAGLGQDYLNDLIVTIQIVPQCPSCNILEIILRVECLSVVWFSFIPLYFVPPHLE